MRTRDNRSILLSISHNLPSCDALAQNPFSGHVFVFRGRHRAFVSVEPANGRPFRPEREVFPATDTANGDQSPLPEPGTSDPAEGDEIYPYLLISRYSPMWTRLVFWLIGFWVGSCVAGHREGAVPVLRQRFPWLIWGRVADLGHVGAGAEVG